MRLCRLDRDGRVDVALYEDDRVVPLTPFAAARGVALPAGDDLLAYLPPDGSASRAVRRLAADFAGLSTAEQARFTLPAAAVRLLVPVPQPKKVILLAGNYAAHIEEGGREKAAERQETFPYFFWKPPSTTLTDPGAPIRIPAVSPDHVDWEIELGVVIGRRCQAVAEADALQYVAGYTVCNDISDRQFRLNPGRKKRDKDGFFDWLHGKWHDTFLPVGPCILAADATVEPQNLALQLRVNGRVMQDANTALMIFPVAALISVLSSFVTLEPGDLLSTGTPSGIGHVRKPPIYLQPGDVVEAEIGGVGILRNPVAAGSP